MGVSRGLFFLVPVHGHAVTAGTTGDAAASGELALGGGRDGTRAASTHLCGGLLQGEELLGAEAWDCLSVAVSSVWAENRSLPS
jgi:hypothetical protein